jgi:branched-chain amino acid transport system ATP-binding protein
VSAGYGHVAAIHDIDLNLVPGEIVALLGPNGAGKTTTISAAAGLVPVRAGEVRLHGRRCDSPLHVRARLGLALVTEERAVLMSLSVRDNLRIGDASIQAAVEIFPELGPLMGRRAGLLSGGEQQMLALGRALSRKPRVILVDELSLGLAPLVVERLLLALRAAARDGAAVLLVEQRTDVALRAADRACVMQRGKIVLEGAAADLQKRDRDIRSVYLTDPDVTGPGTNGVATGADGAVPLVDQACTEGDASGPAGRSRGSSS